MHNQYSWAKSMTLVGIPQDPSHLAPLFPQGHPMPADPVFLCTLVAMLSPVFCVTVQSHLCAAISYVSVVQFLCEDGQGCCHTRPQKEPPGLMLSMTIQCKISRKFLYRLHIEMIALWPCCFSYQGYEFLLSFCCLTWFGEHSVTWRLACVAHSMCLSGRAAHTACNLTLGDWNTGRFKHGKGQTEVDMARWEQMWMWPSASHMG